MNILDEGNPDSQRQLLRRRRISIRHIGYDVGRKGLQDEEIIPFLIIKRRHVTFFTLDADFYKRHLCHARYCLVSMAVRKNEAAEFVRRVLRHPQFNSGTKRMGAVIRVSHVGLSVWRLHSEKEAHVEWAD